MDFKQFSLGTENEILLFRCRENKIWFRCIENKILWFRCRENKILGFRCIEVPKWFKENGFGFVQFIFNVMFLFHSQWNATMVHY